MYVPTASTDTRILDGETDLVVNVTWAGPNLDRTDVGGFIIGTPTPANTKLAGRLVRAINAGAVYTRAELRTDVNGNTYVDSSKVVYGKRLNSDLRKIGF